MPVRHLVAAFLVSIATAVVYGRIAWGMFVRFDDFRDHLLLAQHIYETGRPAAPHFLFHAVTAILHSVPGVPLPVAGGIVSVAMYFLLGLVTYIVLWIAFRDSRAGVPWALAPLTAATLLAQPITSAQVYSIGYLWPEPYHSPTFTMLKPFALAGFAATAWCLSHRTLPRAYTVAWFAAVMILGTLTKPSFAICLLPAAGALVTFRLWQGLPVSSGGLIGGLFCPVLVVLGWQFLVTFSGLGIAGEMYQNSVSWAPLKFMRYWATGLTAKFVASTLFPVAVTALYWRSAWRDPMLQLAWLCFTCGALYSYGVVETTGSQAGNFVWSGYISLFTLFVASGIFWMRQLISAERGWPLACTIICGVVFALHVASGGRLAWLYLAHYDCRVDLWLVKFVCN